jgi:hypothetical protein
MKWMRWTGAVLVGVLLATGLVRGAGTQFGALRDRARRALEVTGAKSDVPVGDDDSGTPQLVLASLEDVAPGSEAEFSVSGTFGPSTRFAIAGQGFTMTTRSSGKNSFEGTVAAAPGTMPGAAVLRATNRHGTSETPVAFVTGAWVIDGTADTGMRLRLATVPTTKKGTLAFRAEIFDKGAKAPFSTRDANIRLGALSGPTASYTVRFEAPKYDSLADSECDPIMKRAHELADKLMKAKDQAEEDRISAEVDKIQDKIDTCVERQQETAGKIAKVSKQASDDQKFSCETLEIEVAADGTAEGTVGCMGKTPGFKGTMKPLAR